MGDLALGIQWAELNGSGDLIKQARRSGQTRAIARVELTRWIRDNGSEQASEPYLASRIYRTYEYLVRTYRDTGRMQRQGRSHETSSGAQPRRDALIIDVDGLTGRLTGRRSTRATTTALVRAI